MRSCTPLLLCLAFLAPASFGATGRVDLGFGTAGKAVIDFAPIPPGSVPPSSYDSPSVVASQPDGKILVAGTTNDLNGISPHTRAASARLNPDGTLDASFGSGGRVIVIFGSCPVGCLTTSSGPITIALLPDGKILVGGFFQTYAGMAPYRDHANLVVFRLHSNGTLDTAFGDSGLASISTSPTSYDFGLMALAPDGRIVLVARTQEPLSGEPPWTSSRLALFRLDANGAPDPSFGIGGKVNTVVGDGHNFPGGAKVLADGRILVVAQVGSFPDLNVAIATFSSVGVLQATSVIDVGSQTEDFLDAVAFQPDGKIVFATSGLSKPALTRVTADGVRDTTFGSNGVVVATQWDSARGLLALPDGKIITLTLDSVLRRFMPDGTSDPSFGVGGVMPVEGPAGQILSVQSDGRLLLASPLYGSFGSDMRVMRIEPDAPAPIEPSVAAVDFGVQSLGMKSDPIALTLTNSSSAALAVAVANGGFPVTHDCAVLAAGASCTVQAVFMPLSEGPNAWYIKVSTVAGTVAIAASGIGEKTLVTHFYRAILRREPDAGGKAFWTAEAARLSAAGVNPNETWFVMAASFYSSPEYAAFARDDAGFVTDLYRTFFDREPDAGGLAYWTGLLGTGTPRSAVLTSFMLSPEFRFITGPTFGNSTARAELDMAMDFYRGILSRTPDQSGLGYWVSQLRAAQCTGADAVRAQANEISRQFLESAEYAARGRGNADHVVDLYNAFMRRGPDAAGIAFWVAQLEAGSSREALRQQFVASPEFSGRVNAVVAQGCVQ